MLKHGFNVNLTLIELKCWSIVSHTWLLSYSDIAILCICFMIMLIMNIIQLWYHEERPEILIPFKSYLKMALLCPLLHIFNHKIISSTSWVSATPSQFYACTSMLKSLIISSSWKVHYRYGRMSRILLYFRCVRSAQPWLTWWY